MGLTQLKMEELYFDENGNLAPEGIHLLTIDEAEEILVLHSQFANSITRELLWDNLQRYNQLLLEYIDTVFEQWICGSFCSTKINPEDIDIVCFLSRSAQQQAEKTDGTAAVVDFFAIQGVGKAKLWHKLFVDAYVVLEYVEGIDPQDLVQLYERERSYWKNWFLTDENYHQRAILQLIIEP